MAATTIDRGLLDTFAFKVTRDAQQWAADQSIDLDDLTDWLRWLCSDAFVADMSGRVGYAFQIGFEVGQVRLAERIGTDDADLAERWKALSDADKVVELDRARESAIRYGNEARRQRDAISRDVDAAVGTKVNRLYALEDAIYQLRRGEISHDEFIAQVDAAPPLEPKP